MTLRHKLSITKVRSFGLVSTPHFSQDSLQFLKDLKENNNRPWFEKNKARYLQAKGEADELVVELLLRFSKFDKPFANVDPKTCSFRIYRDVRFSKNKDPYKSNIGLYFSAAGKVPNPKSGGYYLHFEPGAGFIGAGIYQPQAPELKSIRQEIDYNLAEFEKILNAKSMKDQGLVLSGDKGVRPPKGYDATNPALPYLLHKDFTVGTKISDSDFTSPSLCDKVEDLALAAYPMNAFLERAMGMAAKVVE